MKQNKTKTLLEQVLEAPAAIRGRPRNIPANADVAVAWIKGDVRFVQVARTLWPEKTNANCATQVYSFLNQSIREAYRQGKIKIVE